MYFQQIQNAEDGMPQWVTHYMHVLTDSEKMRRVPFADLRRLAEKRAKQFNGEIYRGNDFDGGIVFRTNDVGILKSRLSNFLIGLERMSQEPD